MTHTGYIISGLLLIIGVYIIITYNRFITLKNQVKEAVATLDVYLKKRWDLIPNLVEVVKGYSEHEKSTLTTLTQLRSGQYSQMTLSDKIANSDQLSINLGTLFSVMEAYPDLKANQNYLDLSKQLSRIEDEIANSRKYYNAVVRILNNQVETIPSNLIAKLFGIQSMDMFETLDRDAIHINSL